MTSQAGGKNRFFPNGLKKGDPVSKKGLVDGIVKMALALDKISVHNGHIDWTGDVPKIIIDRFSK
jgi:hypothetical protein